MKWIDVRTSTPILGSNVLCFFFQGRIDVCKYDIIFNKEEFIENAICVTDDVDYWMYLPNPPKTKKTK